MKPQNCLCRNLWKRQFIKICCNWFNKKQYGWISETEKNGLTWDGCSWELMCAVGCYHYQITIKTKKHRRPKRCLNRKTTIWWRLTCARSICCRCNNCTIKLLMGCQSFTFNVLFQMNWLNNSDFYTISLFILYFFLSFYYFGVDLFCFNIDTIDSKIKYYNTSI